MDLSERRVAFARDLRRRAPLGSDAVERAFATVARETFAGPPPWLIRPNASPLEVSETADPAALYDDVIIAIDPARQLNNGAPGVWFPTFSGLDISPGARVLQVGVGTGYYTALLAELVGPTGCVCALEVDGELAELARTNLSAWPQAQVVAGDGAAPPAEPVDFIVLFAGATHVVDAWLDCLADAGQLLAPLTCNREEPLTGLSLGMALHLTRRGNAFPARLLFPVGIYPCLGARSVEANAALQTAFDGGGHDGVRSLRRDPHAEDPSCWCHLPGRCLSTREA